MIAEKETDKPIKIWTQEEFGKRQGQINDRWKEIMQEGVEERVPRYVKMLANSNPTLRESLEAMEETLFEIYEKENPCGVMDKNELDRLQERRIKTLLEDFHNLLERIIDRALI